MTISKSTKKSCKKKHVQYIKIVLKKKRKKAKKVREKNQNISEEENAKQSQYHF